ncbi:MAG: tetratricopeptide repeat protein [Flavobacteriales bacterium]|nr:tetratricopeptide repeat protein [Flavobacteriales bacterium]
MKRSTKQIILIALSLVVVLIFLFLPKQPASALEAVEEIGTEDIELEQAVQMVQMGQNPMEGILKIRSIVEKDSTNVEAHLWLGIFSLQSGQTDKAKDRFETVLNLEPQQPEAHWQLGQMSMQDSLYAQGVSHFETAYASDTNYVNALFFIGKSYEELGNSNKAIEYYDRYLPFAPDTVVSNRVKYFIDQLTN